MAVNSIDFNWMQTTNAAGSFSILSDGYVQGVAMDDPAVRFSLETGVLASAETLPMWGGCLLYGLVPGGNPQTIGGQDSLGPQLGRATALTQAVGFSVFNQAHNMVNSPQSPAPVALSGMTFSWHRLGSGARIAVAVDATFAQTLLGSSLNQPVSWDFTAQKLVPFVAATPQIAITSLTWAAGVVSVVTAAAHPYVAGDVVTIAGAVPAGYNGDVTILTAADTTHFTYALATNPGAETTPGVILAGGGQLPCQIKDVNIGNSMVVQYNPAINAASWNRQGSTALIQI